MGQRSLLVIRYATECNGQTTYHRIARHLHWNWGQFMIHRAAQVADLMSITDADNYYWHDAERHAKGAAIVFCVNRTTGNVQGINASDDESGYSIEQHDNNNGAFLLDIDTHGQWSFGFLIGRENRGDLATIATAAEYLNASGDSVDNVRRNAGDERADVLALALAQLQEFERGGHAMNQATADLLKNPVGGTVKATSLL
jgi:hypothetical protein